LESQVFGNQDYLPEPGHTFFALAWKMRKEAAMRTMVKDGLPEAIVAYLRNSSGPVMFRELAVAMERAGYDRDDTATAVSSLQQQGELKPGGTGRVSLPV
jgi:hypothetical protein